MNIFVLMAALGVLASAQRPLCPGQPTCNLTTLITACDTSPWLHTSTSLLVLTGEVRIQGQQQGPCVTIVTAGSLSLDNLTLQAPDVRIFAGFTYDQFTLKQDFFEPGSASSDAPQLYVFENSTVSADGLSPLRENKTIAHGGSFAANGGSTDNANSEPFFGYGSYFSNPYSGNSTEQYGAAGFMTSSVGRGGGRILLVSTGDIKIEGVVSSRGGSFKDVAGNGGSGGYIAIDSAGQLVVTEIGGSVSVEGGFGAQGGFGGSGGRIISNIQVANDRPLGGFFKLGGGGSDNCGGSSDGENVNECGGAGTLYNPYKKTLQIGDGQRGTVKRTHISASGTHIPASILIKDKAVGCGDTQSGEQGEAPTALALEAQKITVEGKVREGYLVADRILLQGQSLDLIGDIVDGSFVHEIVLNFTQNVLIDSTQKVMLVGQDAVLSVGGDLTFSKGSIEAYSGGQPGKRLIINSQGSVFLNSKQALINLDKIAFMASKDILIKGTVYSTDTGAFCDAHPQKLDDAYFSKDNAAHSDIDNLNKFEIVTNKIFECSQITSKGNLQNLGLILDSGYKFFYNTTNTPPLPFWDRTVNISKAVLAKNYSIFLVAQERMEVQNEVRGSVIGLCGGDVSITQSGSVNANGMGCPRDKGAGTISWNNTCAGAGASYANNGGYGGMVYNIEYLKQQAALKNITLEQEQHIYNELNGKYMCQSRPFIPIKTTPSMPSYFYVGSGGTSSNTTNGGAGGGMILLNALNTTSIEGQIEAKGGDASEGTDQFSLGSGGGSGGSIFVETSVLAGSGDIKLSGGKGSAPGGGGGAGGAFFFLLRDFYNPQKYPQNTVKWTRGDPVILGGEFGAGSTLLADGGQGSNGFTQSTPCYKGYQLHTCEACPVGTFKDNPSHFECSPCYNLPAHAVYSSLAWINADCPYTCEKDYNLATNGECLTSIQLFFDRIGGIVFLIVGLIILVLCIVGIILCCRFKLAREKKRAERHRQTGDSPQPSEDKELADNRVSLIQKTTFIRKEFGVEDLPYHECRVYLFGSNGFTLDSGWSLPYQPHPAVRDQINEDSYQAFVAEINQAARWSTGQRVLYVLLSVLMPLVGTVYRIRQRSNKFEKIKNLIFSEKENFWKNLRMRELSGSVKPSASSDYTLAYLDFMNWDKSRLDWAGVPSTPLTLLFSGNGSFFSPYYLEQADPLVESIGDMLIRTGGNPKRLQRFLVLLNAHLSTLSFYDLRPLYLSALRRLIVLIDKLNQSYFFPNNYALSLVSFYVQEGSNLLVLQKLHLRNYGQIGDDIGTSVKSGRDAKIGVRIESYRSNMNATFESDASVRPFLGKESEYSSNGPDAEAMSTEKKEEEDLEDDSFYSRKNTKCTDSSCRVWHFFVQVLRAAFFKQYVPLCSKWWIRSLYLLVLLLDIMLSMVPVLYAFEQSLRMPFISILFFYPLVPIISIALNIICLIVWHPLFIRVLISFNALAFLNPLTALIIAACMSSIPSFVGDFWLVSTAGMLVIKLPLAHVASLNLAWMSFPSYFKHKEKLVGFAPIRAPSKMDSQSRQFAAQMREHSGQWNLKRT